MKYWRYALLIGTALTVACVVVGCARFHPRQNREASYEDKNHNQMPDDWEMDNFGDFNQPAEGDFDGDGVSNLEEFRRMTNPNKILFSVTAPNYSQGGYVDLTLSILQGRPFFYEVAVDQTNMFTGKWQRYDGTNIAVDIGQREGRHEVWVRLGTRLVGLKPKYKLDNYAASRGEGLHIVVNRTRPVLVITNPISTNVTQPIIQIKGYSTTHLAKLDYVLNNRAGIVASRGPLKTDSNFDPKSWQFMSHLIDCVDVRLEPGDNTFTFHAEDDFGNETTTNVVFYLVSATNAPNMTIEFPKEDTIVAGDSFEVFGTLDDSSAKIYASQIDARGARRPLYSDIWREGRFRVGSVSFLPEESTVVMVASNMWGFTSTNTIKLKGTAGPKQ